MQSEIIMEFIRQLVLYVIYYYYNVYLRILFTNILLDFTLSTTCGSNVQSRYEAGQRPPPRRVILHDDARPCSASYEK